MPLPNAYNAILARDGISLAEINPGSTELALSRSAALEAIEALNNSHFAILGGDVVSADGNRLEYLNANWYSQRRKGEAAEAFAARSRSEGLKYISAYPRNVDSQPLFVLVVDEVR
jgi:hypothetical protein